MRALSNAAAGAGGGAAGRRAGGSTAGGLRGCGWGTSNALEVGGGREGRAVSWRAESDSARGPLVEKY
jgi:hypothetical protein